MWTNLFHNNHVVIIFALRGVTLEQMLRHRIRSRDFSAVRGMVSFRSWITYTR